MKDFSKRKNAYLGPVCKHGHDHGGGSWRDSANSTCFECTTERIKRYAQTDRAKAKRKEAKKRDKDKIKLKSQEYRQRNRERIAEYNKRYIEENKHWHSSYFYEWNAYRRAHKLKATPAWCERQDIILIYKEAKEMSKGDIKYQVDHIVPLISDLVCGLHCLSNLRIIEAKENIVKGNRWWPDGPFDLDHENGGTNGLNDRKKRLERAKKALGVV